MPPPSVRPADAGRRDDPGRDGEPVLVRRRVDLPELRAAPTRTMRADGSTVTSFIAREVDDEPVVDAAEPAAVVPAAADRDAEPALAREADRRSDVRLVDAVGDRRRPLVDHRVVERARLVVAGVVAATRRRVPLIVRSEAFDCGRSDH